MNDKLNRFTQQLGDNAPLAPDLENQTFATTGEGRGPATGLRVGIALGVVAALAVSLVVANRDSSPTAVTPANESTAAQSAAGVATISKAVALVLPDSYVVASVERPQEQTLNITAASPDGVVLLIKAELMGSDATETSIPSTSEAPGDAITVFTEAPVDLMTSEPTISAAGTMAPESVRHQTVLTNPGDTIQNIADALSVSVNQLVEQYGWSESYVFDSSVYVGWVDPSTGSDNCLVAPCVRYLKGDVVTLYSIAEELGIPGQALAAYNGLGLDNPIATMFPILLPTIEETQSMTGGTLGNVSDSTVATPAVVGIAQDKDLSVTIERFALDDQSLDDSLTQKVHDALVALNTPEQTLQSIVDSIILIPTQPGFASIEEGTNFMSLTLTQASGFADGSFSYVMFTASDGSSAKGMMIRLPAAAIADRVTTDENGIIVAIRSNETTTCIVWLVDGQTVGATDVDVAALAAKGLDYSPWVSDVTPMTTPTTYEVPVLTEAPVDTAAPATVP
jgi:hypothetical protein